MPALRAAVVLWVLAAVAAAGCAVPLASAADDARMKQYAPRPDRVLIYVYRDEGVGYAKHMPVYLDGVSYGQTSGLTYMVFEVPPGPHFLISQAENTSTLLLQTQPGRRYFVWQAMRVGLMSPRAELQEMPEAYAAARVYQCRLVAMPLPP
jgi:hypothetical protein